MHESSPSRNKSPNSVTLFT